MPGQRFGCGLGHVQRRRLFGYRPFQPGVGRRLLRATLQPARKLATASPGGVEPFSRSTRWCSPSLSESAAFSPMCSQSMLFHQVEMRCPNASSPGPTASFEMVERILDALHPAVGRLPQFFDPGRRPSPGGRAERLGRSSARSWPRLQSVSLTVAPR